MLTWDCGVSGDLGCMVIESGERSLGRALWFIGQVLACLMDHDELESLILAQSERWRHA